MALLKDTLAKLVKAHKKVEDKLPLGAENIRKAQKAAKAVSQEVKAGKA